VFAPTRTGRLVLKVEVPSKDEPHVMLVQHAQPATRYETEMNLGDQRSLRGR
jgi:hypothetical protein